MRREERVQELTGHSAWPARVKVLFSRSEVQRERRPNTQEVVKGLLFTYGEPQVWGAPLEITLVSSLPLSMARSSANKMLLFKNVIDGPGQW